LGELVLRHYSGTINIDSGVGLEVRDFGRFFVENVLEAKDIEWIMHITKHPTLSIADLLKLNKEFLTIPPREVQISHKIRFFDFFRKLSRLVWGRD
jgi:hypothetical protein